MEKLEEKLMDLERERDCILSLQDKVLARWHKKLNNDEDFSQERETYNSNDDAYKEVLKKIEILKKAIEIING